MKIRFDNQAKIAGIGLTPWVRLGPDKWFSNYKIASYYGWDMQGVDGAPPVYALSDRLNPVPALSRLNSQALLKVPAFQDILREQMSGYSFFTYKPVTIPPELEQAKLNFLHVDQALAKRLENKVEFRGLFNELLPFPGFKIADADSISTDQAGFNDVMAGRETIVIQNESLNGGKGTYIVRTPGDLQRALDAYRQLEGGPRVVISDYLEGAYERTVQCCATRYGVFVGPLQKQIVANPLLANLDVAEGDRFCGGEVSRSDRYAGAYSEIKQHALRLGEQLIEMGYRGIFGIDCMVMPDGRVYILEVNPRLTGMTPLLTAIYRPERDIPFYLLHTLELAGMDYEITDQYVDPEPSEGGLFVMHAQVPHVSEVTESPQSGRYDGEGNFIAKGYKFEADMPETQVLLQRYGPPHSKVKPGGRLQTVLVNRPVLDENDNVSEDMTKLIQNFQQKITLREV